MVYLIAGIGVVVLATIVALLMGNRDKPGKPADPLRVARRVDIDTGRPSTATQPGTVEPVEPAPLPAALVDFRLLGEADISDERKQELLVALQKIALPPRSLHELMAPEFLVNGTSRDLSDFIMREPLLAAKVLARVNSPFYGLQTPVVSVMHAINFLGMNAVRNQALKSMLDESFSVDSPQLQSLYRNIWDAGMIASELCVLLSHKLGMMDTAAYSTQTVLSFLGNFAVLTLVPVEAAVPIWRSGLLERTRVEQAELGLNSAVLGGMLMRSWGMPQSVTDGVDEMSRVLVTPVGNGDGKRAARLALGYASARIGEQIALGVIHDAAEIDLTGSDRPEYFHLREYLALPELVRLNDCLQSPDIRVATTRMIAAVNPPTGS